MTTMTEDNRKISEYINALKDAGLLVSVSGADPEARIASVSFDSREAGPGTLFICKGLNFKAEYALSAREKEKYNKEKLCKAMSRMMFLLAGTWAVAAAGVYIRSNALCWAGIALFL
ncbi:MAG: DUF3784 domain-containing protein, partial [Firmicutes bacterium]|nr:DUF3784 domain-containing protein [Bacillota bacterium]